jgi:hypothetical protein
MTRPPRAFVQAARSGQDPHSAPKRAERVAEAFADGHGVVGRAGDGAGLQVDAELVFGIAMGVAHRGHLGAHVVTPLGLLVQGCPVGVGRITVNLKVFRFRAAI